MSESALPALNRRQRAVWPTANTELRVSSSGLAEFIRRDGLTMGLCDGRNKPAEIADTARLLAQPGNLLLARDHEPSRDYFAANIKGVRCSRVNDHRPSNSSQSDCD